MATIFAPLSGLLTCARSTRPCASRSLLSSFTNRNAFPLNRPEHVRHVSVQSDPTPPSTASNTPTTDPRFATDLQRNVTREEQDHYDAALLSSSKTAQIRTPWHRADTHVPPVHRSRSAGAMTKGKLLTTPTRLFKLILPLTTSDVNSDRRDVEPLALLVHPQQPLSYLERLIQSELPTIQKEGKERIPSVHFRAQDSMTEEEDDASKNDEDSTNEESQDANEDTTPTQQHLRGGPGEGGVESYSPHGREHSSP